MSSSKSSTEIILYDIPSPLPGKAWSPNAWKARYVLNYKGLAYRTEWIEYPEIEPLSKSLGVQPTMTRPNGDPLYTIPMIHDLATGKAVSDSFEIAKYLDDTYPEAPAVLPKAVRGLQAQFHHSIARMYLVDGFKLVIPAQKLNPPSMEYYIRTKQEVFGKPWEEIAPQGEDRLVAWKRIEGQVSVLDKCYAENISNTGWIMGDTPSFVDFVVAGYLTWIKQNLPDEWETHVKNWNEGRWAKLLKQCNKYAAIV